MLPGSIYQVQRLIFDLKVTWEKVKFFSATECFPSVCFRPYRKFGVFGQFFWTLSRTHPWLRHNNFVFENSIRQFSNAHRCIFQIIRRVSRRNRGNAQSLKRTSLSPTLGSVTRWWLLCGETCSGSSIFDRSHFIYFLQWNQALIPS